MTDTFLSPSRALNHPLPSSHPNAVADAPAVVDSTEPSSGAGEVETAPPPTAEESPQAPVVPRAVPDYIQQSALLMQTYQAIQPAQRGIEDLTRTMESASSTSRMLHQQTAVLHAVEAAMTAVSSKDDKQHDLTTLMVSLGSGPPISARRALDDAGLGGSFPGNSVTLRTTGKVAEELSSRTSAANEDTSMQMIRLQELMHQKNLFLQLATNMASSEEQITRRIAENIR